MNTLYVILALGGVIIAAYLSGKKQSEKKQSDQRADILEEAVGEIVDEHRESLEEVGSSGLRSRLLSHAAKFRKRRRDDSGK